MDEGGDLRLSEILAALYSADDFTAKRNVKTVNHSYLPEALGYILENVGSKRDLARVLRAGSKTAKKMTEIRCERGDVLVQSARILAVADIVEAMTAERPYRAAMPAEQALALMRDDVGTKLCPDAFAALSGALPAQLAA